MKRKIISVAIALLTIVSACCLFSACKEDDAFLGNDGWEGWYGWNGEDNEFNSSAGDIDLPSFDYNGSDWTYVGAEDTHY